MSKMRPISCLLMSFQLYAAIASKVIEDPASDMTLLAVCNHLNQFSTKLYQGLAKYETGNFIASTFSVSMVLSMLSYAARGDTEKQLKTALNMLGEANIQKTGIKTLVQNLHSELANKIFMAKNSTTKPEFNEFSQLFFNSQIENIDFNETAKARKLIEDWAKQRMNSKVESLLASKFSSSDTAMIVASVLHFKGNWAIKFDKDSTHNQLFYLENNTVKSVSMMYVYEFYRISELSELNARSIEIPYESDGISMFIILPDHGSSLEELEENLSRLPLSALLNGRSRKVDLFLPKFEIGSAIDYKIPLTHMGLGNIFSNSADFSGITDSMLLKVSEFVQQMNIEVNEEGSQAAAETTEIFVPFSESVAFLVNRPFYYAIVKRLDEEDNGIVLFHGHYRG